jgi:ATPase subunit of ABC transporter with duplicated ATPase domains
MTTEEHKNIIGGVVLEYAEVKQKLAALEAEMQNALSRVRQAEEVVRFKSMGDHHKSDEEVESHLKNWPAAERLRELLRDLKEGNERKAALEKTMKQYGIQL